MGGHYLASLLTHIDRWDSVWWCSTCVSVAWAMCQMQLHCHTQSQRAIICVRTSGNILTVCAYTCAVRLLALAGKREQLSILSEAAAYLGSSPKMNVWENVHGKKSIEKQYHTRTHACMLCTHAHTHVRTHACTHAHTHACMHTRMHTRTHTHTHSHTHTRYWLFYVEI